MQSALSAPVWSSLRKRLSRTSRVLLALDFDGTLAPIVEDPTQAAIPPRTLALLRALAERPDYRIAIVSGRALTDVRRRVEIPRAIYGGNHGLEVEIEGRLWMAPGAEEASGAVQEAGKALGEKLKRLHGVVLENKGISISVHYRQAPVGVKQTCLRLCGQALDPFVAMRKVNVLQGKEVVEVQPALPWDKGACLRHLAKLSLSGDYGPGVCIFLGDDTFDEPAFRAVRDMGGIGIFIGEKADSAAAFFLPSTTSVEIFLRRLVSISRKR
ncbi:MAG: trehalose-phosphatase [Dehalococcoidia bacterium]|nr:trehalose-phosphatase [Dehalococcoidia bacterium]